MRLQRNTLLAAIALVLGALVGVWIVLSLMTMK